MPGLYKDGDYDLGGFAVGAAERGTLLPTAGHRGGRRRDRPCVLGRAFQRLSRWCARSSSNPALPTTRRHRSRRSLTLGAALLTPTKLYVKSCLRAIRDTGAVKGLAHITGGGFTDNIPRVLPKHLGVGIDLARLPVLPVFKMAGASRAASPNSNCCAPSTAASA